MRKYGSWFVLFALLFVVMVGGCGGGGGDGGGGALGDAAINGTWKIYSVIDNILRIADSGQTVTVTRNGETGEIRLSGNGVSYEEPYPQGYLEFKVDGGTYAMRGVPSSTLKTLDDSEGAYGDLAQYVKIYSSDEGVTFTFVAESQWGGVDVLDYEVEDYKIDFVRN
jgi:hypothetical protein